MLPLSRENATKQPSVPSVKKEERSPPAQRPVWKVLVFFIPMPAGGGLPQPPGNKNWVDILLLVIKVLVALAGLWKAVAVLGN